MNSKKGQAALGVGMLIAVAITIIVGAILFQVSAQNVGAVTNTVVITNQSVALTNNTAAYLTNVKAITSPVIWNVTSDTRIGAGNYTITNNFVHDGALTVRIVPHVNAAAYLLGSWNISGTGQPTTYVNDGGSRAMVNLVLIFFALAVAMIALAPVLQNKILSN